MAVAAGGPGRCGAEQRQMMAHGEKRSIQPSPPRERQGRARLSLRGEFTLAFFPTLTILIVLWTVEAFADQRVLFSALLPPVPSSSVVLLALLQRVVQYLLSRLGG